MCGLKSYNRAKEEADLRFLRNLGNEVWVLTEKYVTGQGREVNGL